MAASSVGSQHHSCPLPTCPPQVTQNGLALVLDLAVGAFVKAGPLVDIMADLLGGQRGAMQGTGVGYLAVPPKSSTRE